MLKSYRCVPKVFGSSGLLSCRNVDAGTFNLEPEGGISPSSAERKQGRSMVADRDSHREIKDVWRRQSFKITARFVGIHCIIREESGKNGPVLGLKW